MSDEWAAWGTPRTDAFYMRDCGCKPRDRKPHEWAAFARQLEREIQRNTLPRLVQRKGVFDFEKEFNRLKRKGA